MVAIGPASSEQNRTGTSLKPELKHNNWADWPIAGTPEPKPAFYGKRVTSRSDESPYPGQWGETNALETSIN
ncbi:hypothetical protein N7516_002869 [Penicillium verrucosum]|uniref:uncharacterized protein n=1 Tax=Penicillium verrucosum TaxID=60171 RepID=UPI002544D631|nr:uncharacterized protein N7516_002869 [Penicillium verrucosum]KAJ5942701.1 hypothetical protein N7516_002869 [Penicillium verrucosum]